jgi:dolichol-phosphate mannosyltransferase
MMQSGTRDDYNGASLASNIDAMQRGATGTVPLEMKSMTVTESPHDERTIRVSPTQLREAVELKNPVKIAIVIPALNEELGIGKVLDEIHGTLDGHKLRVSDMLNTVVVPLKPEVVVVDGGSTDSTASVTKSHGEVLVRQRGRGYGHALVTGFSYAIEAFDPDVLVMIDADGTYDVADIPRLLLPILSDEADLVLGNRFAGLQPGAMTSTNRIGNRVISWVARHFLGVHVSDTQCGLRALSPDVVKLFNGYANGMSFATEMLADAEQAGARIAEVSIVYRPRIGETKLDPLHDGARILSIIMRLLRDYKPLLFFGGLGFIFALTGLALGVDVLLEWLSTGSVRRIPMTILSVLLFGAGLQLASLGLLADMIKGLRSHKRLPAVPFGKTVS